MEVKLVSATKVNENYIKNFSDSFKDLLENSNEALSAYIARVSSPNQTNEEFSKLIGFCVKHGHWSVLEHIFITFDIKTSRAIAAQILRHRSFTFQEFSQRYSKVTKNAIERYNARRQAKSNRQSSIDDMTSETKSSWLDMQDSVWEYCYSMYEKAISLGIAKECARNVLPLNTQTRLFMSGTLRSWVHYLELRTEENTQEEHREIALAIQNILIREYPIVSKAMGWN